MSQDFTRPNSNNVERDTQLTICTSGPSKVPPRLEMLTRIIAARRLVKCYVYGELCPAVQGRTESTSWSTSLPNLVYFELEDPFCSGLYPLVQEDLTGALAAMSALTTVGDDIRDRAAVGIAVVLFTTHNHSELRTMTATKLSRP